jgi:hypothetical protein
MIEIAWTSSASYVVGEGAGERREMGKVLWQK